MNPRLIAGTVFAITCVYTLPLQAASSEVQELKALVEKLSERVVALEARLKERDAAPQQIVAESAPVSLDAAAGQPAVAKTPEVPKVSSGNDRIKLSISGQVNRGVLFADNSNRSKFFHVDNDNSATRFGLYGEGKINDDFSAGARIVLDVESNSSNDIDIVRSEDNSDVISERELDLYLDSKRFGRLWIGKGETASDTTNEIDLSETGVIADGASGIEEFAGGISFHNRKAPNTPGPRIKTVYANFDGLDIKNRIRYDTPSFYGFSLGASHADTDSYDGAVKFAGDFAGHKVQAAAAATRDYPDFAQYNASMSVLFSCGLSLTGAWGIKDFRKAAKKVRENADQLWGKIGYQQKWFSPGLTAVAADFGRVRNLEESGDRAKAGGVFFVQNIDAIAAEIFWGARWHRLNRRKASFGTIKASMVGVRIKF